MTFTEKTSLHEFMAIKCIDPERNNPIEWYRPKEFFYKKEVKLELLHVFEFQDAVGEKLYIVDDLNAPHSSLYTKDEIMSLSAGYPIFED